MYYAFIFRSEYQLIKVSRQRFFPVEQWVVIDAHIFMLLCLFVFFVFLFHMSSLAWME